MSGITADGNRLTNSYLGEVRKRAEAATPGPWTDGKWIRPPATGAYAVNYAVDDSQRQHDAAFIAHAREDVPRLLDALDRVRALADWYDRPQTSGRALSVVAEEIRAALDGAS